jgi:uncharacterized damage-inducible protein DinB
MMQRIKWIDKKFPNNLPEGLLPDILERLRGTPARIGEMVSMLSETQLSEKPGGASWSIKEHIGHLSDLEEVHEGRIADIVAGKEVMRAADMSNKRTYISDHNQKSIQQLLRDFKIKRYDFIAAFEKMGQAHHQFSLLHPRLKIMMKPVDLAFFIAEHDDHHLTSIRQILKSTY